MYVCGVCGVWCVYLQVVWHTLHRRQPQECEKRLEQRSVCVQTVGITLSLLLLLFSLFDRLVHACVRSLPHSDASLTPTTLWSSWFGLVWLMQCVLEPEEDGRHQPPGAAKAHLLPW